MDERIAVAPRDRGAPVREEDAHRVGVLRRIAAARLRLVGLETLIDPACLVVSELVTNALRHSGTREIRLVLGVRDGFLIMVVIDGMPREAVPLAPDASAESGRGLLMVQAIAEEHNGSWGTGDGGAQTWCRLVVPAEVSAGESP
ncbi:ATP-binding protein [Streptomyces sp. NPDC093252]|uniref:ATP-binding protein n=1 Tax=Streptomyces sp. NPDC093252 TaxID=3154980 RepID=UPI00342E3B6E